MANSERTYNEKNLLHEYVKNHHNKSLAILSTDADAFIIADLQGDVVYGSSYCENLIGYSSLELVKMNLCDLFPKGFHLLDVTDKSVQNVETDILRKADSTTKKVGLISIPILVNQELIGMYIVIKNLVSNHKRKRHDLLEQEKFNSSWIEHLYDGIIFVRGSAIINVNMIGLNLLGTGDKDCILGKSIFDFFPPEDIKTVETSFSAALVEGVTALSEQRFINMDGELLKVDVQIVPTTQQHEQIFFLIIRDNVQKEKHLELSILSEKLSAAGQLAAGIAHEIRNPITAIKGFLQLIMEERGGIDKYHEVINSEINRVEEVLKELLILAKPNDKKYGYFNICVLLEQVMTLMESQALLNNIQIELKLITKNAVVLCDQNQIKQVFINLVKNAMEAMQSGGRIQIEVENRSEGVVQIRVNDEGGGIPIELIERIGEPFFTTKSNGTGLGMLVSKQIIDDHNGSMAIITDSKGTCIQVNLLLHR